MDVFDIIVCVCGGYVGWGFGLCRVWIGIIVLVFGVVFVFVFLVWFVVFFKFDEIFNFESIFIFIF